MARSNEPKSSLMEDSGQTDEERRLLRSKQRQLKDSILTDDANLDELTEQNNQLFSSVKYTREAFLDADNMTEIIKKQALKTESLVQVARFDAQALVTSLKVKCRLESGDFDWKTLGRETGICYNALPSHVSFLAGCLDESKELQVRERKRQRVEEKVHENVEATEMTKTKSDPDKLSATDKSMKVMDKKLTERCSEENEINGVQFLLNPQSFTQTVENIFHFSFLVKKGKAAIGVRSPLENGDRKGLWITKVTEGEAPPARQAVIALTMNDWKKLSQHVEEGDLPTRSSRQS